MRYIKEYNSSRKTITISVKPNWDVVEVVSSYKKSLYNVCRYFYDTLSPILDTVDTDEIKSGCFYDSDSNTLDVLSVSDSDYNRMDIDFEHSLPLFIPIGDCDITMIVSSEDCILYVEESGSHVFSYSMIQNDFVEDEEDENQD